MYYLKAADEPNAQLVKFIVDQGIDKTHRDVRMQNTLYYAITNKNINVETLEVMLDAGFDVN